MTDDWYFTNAGQQVGPMSFAQMAEELQKLAQWREEYVWRLGWDDWRRTTSIPALVLIASPRTTRPSPPAPTILAENKKSSSAIKIWMIPAVVFALLVL